MNELDQCQTCGVPVMSRNRHQQWHRDQDNAQRTVETKLNAILSAVQKIQRGMS